VAGLVGSLRSDGASRARRGGVWWLSGMLVGEGGCFRGLEHCQGVGGGWEARDGAGVGGGGVGVGRARGGAAGGNGIWARRGGRARVLGKRVAAPTELNSASRGVAGVGLW